MLLLVNGLSLIYTCVSRPYEKTLLNVLTILNDVGVLIVICTFYPLRNLYITDASFYLYGKIIIGCIAGIIFLNLAIFGVAFVIALIDFLKRCPICSCCVCKKKPKELLIIDPD